MKPDEYVALLRDLAVADAVKLKPIERDSTTMSSNDFWVYARLTSNKKTLINPASKGFDDWFELYNPNASPIDLAGYFLTTDPTNPTLFKIPAGSILPAHGFVLVWADGGLSNLNDATNHFLHAGFRLKKTGSLIALLDGNTNLVDSVSFGTQTSDVSGGRYPDGGDLVYSFAGPTPATENSYTNTAPVMAALPAVSVTAGFPISFKAAASDLDVPPQNLVFSLEPGLPAALSIDPVTGVVSWDTEPALAPGIYPVVIRVSDNGTPKLTTTGTVSVQVISLPGAMIQISPPSFSNNRLTLRWASTPGTRYRIQFSRDLGLSSWVDALAEFVATDANATFVDAIPEGEGRRFYRILRSQ